MKAIRTIGFTGTIASGKTTRCKRLVEVAQQRQATLANPRAATAAVTGSSYAGAVASNATGPSSVAVHYINADLVGHDIYASGKPCYYEVLQHFGSSILCKAPSDTAAPPSLAHLDESSRWRATATAASPPAALAMIDRRVLGEIVFSEERKLQELNAICWPYITAAIKDEYAKVCASFRADPAISSPGSLSAAAAAAGSSVSPAIECPTAGLSPATKTMVSSPSAAGSRADVGLIIIEAALLCEMAEVLGLTTDVWITHCTTATAVDRVMVRNHLSRESAEKRVASQDNVESKLNHLRHLPYTGDIEVFETTQVSLSQGLKEMEAAFERYWREKIAVHL